MIAPHQAAVALSGKLPDAQGVGAALGVRYALMGRARRLPDKLRVSVELVSTETGTLLWTDQFEDEPNIALAEPRVMAGWIRSSMFAQLILAEGARSLRERPDNPDLMDLMLRGNTKVRWSGLAGLARLGAVLIQGWGTEEFRHADRSAS